MKTFYTFLSLAFTILGMLLIGNSNGQSIRKNYREMTTAEKTAYCAALDVLKANGTIASLATLHNSNFTPIHNRPMFLPWHRYFLYDYEQMLRATGASGAQDICIPYWDWTSEFYTSSPKDNSKNAPLWTATDFIGKYNTPWSLGRSTSGSDITFSITIDNLLTQTAFDYSSGSNFAPSLETNLHNSPHGWVGGVMGGGSSPGDPAFFLHHNMVDKIWQDWHNLGGGRISSPFYDYGTTTPATSMPVYTTINPYNLVDSRSLKVWYAENNKVLLDNYTVSGTEKYRYTGLIEATTVTVPTSTNAEMISASQIVFNPGFVANTGSTYTARIDAASFLRTAAAEVFADNNVFVAKEYMGFNESNLSVFPNPSGSLFNVALITNSDVNYNYKIINSLGAVVENVSNQFDRQFEVDLHNQPAGIYVLQMYINNKVYNKMLVLEK